MSRKNLATTRLKEDEYEELKSKATELGISISEYIRRAALGRRMPNAPVPKINRKAWADLARVCSNLNQCQKALNQGLSTNIPTELLETLFCEVQSLRQELLGVKK